MWTDSHCHLQGAADPDGALERARAAGVTRVVCIGTDAHQSRQALALARDGVWATVGLHPHDAKEGVDGVAALLEEVAGAEQSALVAVGECGLDYHYDHSPRATQRDAFAAQVGLAHRYGLALVVHTRDAEDDTRGLAIVAGRGGVIGVFHCYTGSHGLARAALDVGWYVSFSGIITFKKWTDDALLRLIPDDRLLVESDSPYLAPVPHRGKRNEPAWVSFTVERLARARAVTAAHVTSRVIANAVRLFSMDLHSDSSRKFKETDS